MVKITKCQIEITNKCNLNCGHCSFNRNNGNREIKNMEPDLFEKCLEFLKKMKVMEIRYHLWGEPTLHPNLNNFIKMGKKEGFHVGFTTNSLNITKDHVKKWAELKLDLLDVSYDINRKDNYNNKAKLVHDWAKEFGITSRFRISLNTNTDYEKIVEELGRLYSEEEIRFQKYEKMDQRVKCFKCPVKNKSFSIYVDGTLVPCSIIANEEYSYFNLSHYSPNIAVRKLKKEIHHLSKKMRKNSLNFDDFPCKGCFETVEPINVAYKLGKPKQVYHNYKILLDNLNDENLH